MRQTLRTQTRYKFRNPASCPLPPTSAFRDKLHQAVRGTEAGIVQARTPRALGPLWAAALVSGGRGPRPQELASSKDVQAPLLPDIFLLVQVFEAVKLLSSC